MIGDYNRRNITLLTILNITAKMIGFIKRVSFFLKDVSTHYIRLAIFQISLKVCKFCGVISKVYCQYTLIVS